MVFIYLLIFLVTGEKVKKSIFDKIPFVFSAVAQFGWYPCTFAAPTVQIKVEVSEPDQCRTNVQSGFFVY